MVLKFVPLIKQDLVMGEIKWRKAFIEIALRAMRKVHIEYGIWGIGKGSGLNREYQKLNIGPGIELALETSVCSAISQEFINSLFTNGDFVNGVSRRYTIERETKIWFKNYPEENYNGEKKKFIDFVINRYKIEEKNDHIKYYRYPAFIEAKRISQYKPKISSGDIKNTGNGDLKKDINKLKEIRCCIKDNNYGIELPYYLKESNNIKSELKDAFLYLLLWDTIDTKKVNSRKELIQQIESHLEFNIDEQNFELRWFPLQWKIHEPEVEKWLWLALIEIDPLPPPGLGDENWFIIKEN